MNLSNKFFYLQRSASRIPHKVLSYLGIRWEYSYLLVQTIDRHAINSKQSKITEFCKAHDVKELTYEDFLSGDKENFTPKKLAIIRERFSRPDRYKAYGIVADGKLIYSCWLSFNDIDLPFGIRLPMEEAALFLDDYCSPDARGRGIHTMMNFFRLSRLLENGKRSAAVLIITFNKPALKSQITAGFKKKAKIFTYKIGNHTGYRIKNIDRN